MFDGIRNGTPLCEIISHTEGPCMWESVVRLWTECECGHRALRFFCKAHSRGLQERRVLCYHCRSNQLKVKVSL